MEEWCKNSNWPYCPTEDGEILERLAAEEGALLCVSPIYDEGYFYWFHTETSNNGKKLMRKQVPVPSINAIIKIIEIRYRLFYPSLLSFRPSKSRHVIFSFASDLKESLEKYPTQELLYPLFCNKRIKKVLRAVKKLKTSGSEIRGMIEELQSLYKELEYC